LFFLVLPLAVPAATLTTVPMQGGGVMIMPMISYDAGLGRMAVMMPPQVPQLTPLLVSNPLDNFDPADPWFTTLDPTQQGQSFSRQYGFMMDVGSDPLPPGATNIWIRKLSASPELSCYRYSGSAPAMWDPVFGTAGSSSAVSWNAKMWHPAFTAPAGTNGSTAVFDVYLAYNGTSNEVPGSASDAFLLDFTNVPDGRPAVDLLTRVAVCWPASTSNYVLECATSLSAADWTAVTNAPVPLDGEAAVILPPEEGGKFYRMRYEP